jgi:proteasome accessory factor C
MSAADRLTRLFALVPYLQNNQGVPVKEVAAEFGVTVKEIIRDINTLCLTGTADVHGELIDFDYSALEDEGLIYIRDAEFLPRPLRLSRDEGVALVIGLRALRESADDGQREVIDSALAKLEAAVGDAARTPVDIHVERVDAELLATVREALEKSHRLEIDYTTQSRDERAHRQVDPLRLFTSEGHHYLEAWCLREQDVRVFRLDRMLGASLTGEPAETREAEPRDLAADLVSSPDAPQAVFDLEPRAHWMVEYYHATVLGSPGQEAPDVLRVRIVGADWAWLVRFALRHAGVARAVEPAALVEDVATAARAALSAYDGITPSTTKE